MNPAERVQRALEKLLELRPAAYGMDRGARAKACAGIHALLPRRDKGLPSAREIAQLAELSGGAFITARRQLVARLQHWLDALAARGAPAVVRDVLKQLAPDQPALVRDADEAWRALNGRAFKSVVVMTGAVMEGLLHAALEALGPAAGLAFSALYPRRRPPPRAEAYTVDDAIAVLQQAGRLSGAAAQFARGLKDLRNLVHPALERRKHGRVSPRHAQLALLALEVLSQELAS